MPRSSKRAERPAVGDFLALALHDVDRHRGLAVLVRRELLRARDRDRRIARNDLLGEPAHRLEAERQRDHVEQQPVVVALAIAGELVGLDRRAERDDFVRIEIGERRLAEELGDRAAHLRHARRAADEHDALDVGRRQLRVAQRALDGLHASWRRGCAVISVKIALVSVRLTDVPSASVARIDAASCSDRFSLASRALTSSSRASAGDSGGSFAASMIQQNTRWSKSSPPSAESPLVASTSNTPLRQAQDRDVERAAAQVVDRVDAFGRVVEAVGDRRGRRLVQQAQDRQARELRRVLRRLPLRVVEIRGHGDDGAIDRAAERRFRALAQRAQQVGGDFDRRSSRRRACAIFTMPGASTKRYGKRRSSARSARPRPISRLTDTIVFCGSLAWCAIAS